MNSASPITLALAGSLAVHFAVAVSFDAWTAPMDVIAEGGGSAAQILQSRLVRAETQPASSLGHAHLIEGQPRPRLEPARAIKPQPSEPELRTSPSSPPALPSLLAMSAQSELAIQALPKAHAPAEPLSGPPVGGQPTDPRNDENIGALVPASARASMLRPAEGGARLVAKPRAPHTEKPSESLRGEDISAYRLALARFARQVKDYPALARERSWEGLVQVEVITGVPAQVRLAKSSGYEVLDESALTMARFAVSRANLPESLAKAPVRLSLPIDYRLDDW